MNRSFKTWPYKNKKIHFIGIGGIGVSGLAKICQFNQSIVSGSDAKESYITADLEECGIKVFIGHQEENLQACELVVISSAIKEDNPELKKARREKIKVMLRGQFLAELLESFFVISIAGSHGKTTTSSLCSVLLNDAGLPSNFLVGGVLKNYGSQVGTYQSKNFVVEVDESDGSFLQVASDIAILTNIDNDHLNYYKTIDNIAKAFETFVAKAKPSAVIIYNRDDKYLAQVMKKTEVKSISFALSEKADYQISEIKNKPDSTSFKLNNETYEIPLIGLHNVYNASAAIILGKIMERETAQLQHALKGFKGVGRRQDIVYQEDDLLIIDDYAHHPTEVKKTIISYQQKYQDRLVVVFEPHRYTRTHECWGEFLTAFDEAPQLYLLPIYSAGEAPITNVSSEQLIKEINQKRKVAGKVISNLAELKFAKNSIVLAMGAGPISKEIRSFAKKLKNDSL
ncbi:MAG: UDP-N-acetylmuramate--L-alanine ligase [Bacteriovoracaceae bacterium]|nr:UDP-N-acetylmuramate--L-alanine ligase [Bacteriovoracaceae bacterium]